MPKNSSKQSNASPAKRRWRALAKLIILALLIFAANLAADWVVTALKLELRPSNEDAVHQVLMISALASVLRVDDEKDITGPETERLLAKVKDPVGTFYMYGLASATISKRRQK